MAWADVLFVMEPKHRARVVEQFRDSVGETPLHVLDIPDDYEFMNPELVDLIRDRVESYFGVEDSPGSHDSHQAS